MQVSTKAVQGTAICRQGKAQGVLVASTRPALRPLVQKNIKVVPTSSTRSRQQLIRTNATANPSVNEAFESQRPKSTFHASKLFCLDGKVAFVTGAAGGVGVPLCLALARSGADVVLADLPEKEQSIKAVIEEIESYGRKAVFAGCDVRSSKSVEEAMETCNKAFGRIDILVCNAGILGEMLLPQDMTEDNWHNVIATNLDGTLFTTKSAYPLLKKSDSAKVIIMSSIAGQYGYGPQAAYCAAKGALLPLSKSLALAWAKDNIHVNVVMPGATNTPFTKRVLHDQHKLEYMLDRIPLARLADPDDLIGPILFFASRASDYCTGTQLVVDGGGTARAMAK